MGAVQLMKPGETWRLQRRMPARFAQVEPRREVLVPLNIDPRQQALK